MVSRHHNGNLASRVVCGETTSDRLMTINHPLKQTEYMYVNYNLKTTTCHAATQTKQSLTNPSLDKPVRHILFWFCEERITNTFCYFDPFFIVSHIEDTFDHTVIEIYHKKKNNSNSPVDVRRVFT